jgi:tetratricopeptide (TPR) repeat protein
MGVTQTVNEFLLSKLFDEAQYYTDHKMWLHAAQVYHRLLADQDGPAELYTRLASVYAEMGNIDAAERTLLNALGRDRGNVDVLTALAMLFFNARDFDKARYYLEQLVPHRLAHAHFLLGAISTMDHDWIHAERHYRLACELDPSSTDAFARLIEVLLHSRQPRKAIELLHEKVEADHDDWKSLYLLGLAYSLGDQWLEALNCLSEVLSARPDDVDVLCATAESLIGLNQADRARETLLHALSVDPQSVRGLTLLARAELRRGERAKAREYYEKALEIDASNLDALEGMRYVLAGNHEQQDH